MEKQLLIELELYIKKNKVEDIVIREVDKIYDYIMPMKSSKPMDGIHKEDTLSNEEKDDTAWLEPFRKKPSKAIKKKDISYSKTLISDEEDIKAYISKEKSVETFTTKLLTFIDRSGLADSEIYKKAGIDRRHFSKIRCDKYYKPKKTTAIALCIALELTIEETVELLGLAGYSLSNCDTADLVVKFCIERKIYNLIDINAALDYFGQKMLGVVG